MQMVLVVVLVAGAYLLLPQLVGVGDALQVLRQLSLPFVAGALGMQAVSVLAHAHVVQESLRIFGHALSFASVLEVSLASSFATLLLPSVGLSGLAVRCRYLGERGCSVGATGVAFTIEALAQAAAHTSMVTVAVAYRLLRGRQPPWAAVILILSVTLFTAAALAALLAKPSKRDWRYRILRVVNGLRHRGGRPIISESAVEGRLAALQSSVQQVGAGAARRLLICSIVRNSGAVMALYLVLRALDRQPALSAVALSFSCADVLGGMSSLPAGLLVAETSLSALLNRTGVPLAIAVTGTLVFRLISLWLPRALGLLAWVHLQRRSKKPLWS